MTHPSNDPGEFVWDVNLPIDLRKGLVPPYEVIRHRRDVLRVTHCPVDVFGSSSSNKMIQVVP